MAWIDVNMPDGTRYYSNLQTQQSTWTTPPGFTHIASDWAAMDDGGGNLYYLNHITNESSWEMPEAYKKALYDGDIAEQEFHKALVPSSQIASGKFFSTWVEQKNESGIPYYFNTKTSECVWDKPIDYDGDGHHVDPDTIEMIKKAVAGKLFIIPKHIQEAHMKAVKKYKQEKGSAGQWVEVFDPTLQQYYYYDHSSNETRWDKPDNYILMAEDELMISAVKLQCQYRSKKARRIAEEKRKQKELEALEKPKAIGDIEAENPPKVCISCEEGKSATKMCVDCDEYYCNEHYDKEHRKGNRVSHLYKNIILPVEMKEAERMRSGSIFEDTLIKKEEKKLEDTTVKRLIVKNEEDNLTKNAKELDLEKQSNQSAAVAREAKRLKEREEAQAWAAKLDEEKRLEDEIIEKKRIEEEEIERKRLDAEIKAERERIEREARDKALAEKLAREKAEDDAKKAREAEREAERKKLEDEQKQKNYEALLLKEEMNRIRIAREEAERKAKEEERRIANITYKWIERKDDLDKLYYIQSESGEIVYDVPTDGAKIVKEIGRESLIYLRALMKGKNVTMNSALKVAEVQAKIQDEQLLGGPNNSWIEAFDPTQGCMYYFNSITGEQTWEKPEKYVMAANDDIMLKIVKIQSAFRKRIAKKKMKYLRVWANRSDATELNQELELSMKKYMLHILKDVHFIQLVDQINNQVIYMNIFTNEVQNEKPESFLSASDNARGMAACKMQVLFKNRLAKRKIPKDRWRKQRGNRQLKRLEELGELQEKIKKVEQDMKAQAEMSDRRKKELKRLQFLAKEEQDAARLQFAKEKRLLNIHKRRNRMQARHSEDKKDRLLKKKMLRIENGEKQKQIIEEESKAARIASGKFIIQFRHAAIASRKVEENNLNYRKLMQGSIVVDNTAAREKLIYKANITTFSVWEAAKTPLCEVGPPPGSTLECHTCFPTKIVTVPSYSPKDCLFMNPVQCPNCNSVLGGPKKFEQLLYAAIQKGYELEDRDAKTGECLIHIACFEGHINLVKWLVFAGVSVNSPDTSASRATPLLESVRGGHEEIAKFLLEKGAIITDVDKHGNSVMHFASIIGIPTLLRSILTEPNGIELLNLKNYKQQIPIDICSNGSCRFLLKSAMDVLNPKNSFIVAAKDENGEENVGNGGQESQENNKQENLKELSKDSIKDGKNGNSLLNKPGLAGLGGNKKAKQLASLKK